MKLKLNIAFFVMIALILWNFCSGMQNGYEAFMTGFNEGYSNQVENSFFFMNLAPDNYMAQDRILNTKTGEYEAVTEISKSIMVRKPHATINTIVTMVAVFLGAPLMIAFWVCFIKVIFSANKSEKVIFTKKIEKRLMRCAVYLGISSLIYLADTFVGNMLSRDAFAFEGMHIETNYSDNIMLFIIATGFVMVSEIFRIARKLKEDQELTI